MFFALGRVYASESCGSVVCGPACRIARHRVESGHPPPAAGRKGWRGWPAHSTFVSTRNKKSRNPHRGL
eukprot:scaffold102625_cov30-Tisochrysis_lutea.AAC.1